MLPVIAQDGTAADASPKAPSVKDVEKPAPVSAARLPIGEKRSPGRDLYALANPVILSQAPPILAPGEIIAVRERPVPLPPRLTTDAQAAHRQFIASLGENAIWRDYVSLD